MSETSDPQPQASRRRKEDLVKPLAYAIAALLVVLLVVSVVVLRTAAKAKTAADRANENTVRIEAAERGFCNRLQGVRDLTNRNGAIIFVVLRAATQNTADQGQVEEGRDYRRIAALPEYQPPTNCDLAIADPLNYKPSTPVPFVVITRKKLREILAASG